MITVDSKTGKPFIVSGAPCKRLMLSGNQPKNHADNGQDRAFSSRGRQKNVQIFDSRSKFLRAGIDFRQSGTKTWDPTEFIYHNELSLIGIRIGTGVPIAATPQWEGAIMLGSANALLIEDNSSIAIVIV